MTTPYILPDPPGAFVFTSNMVTDGEYTALDIDLDQYYKNVKTWDDLIQTNIDFIEGRQPYTFYYCTTFHDHAYRDGTYKIEEDLLRLHKEFGIFTENGQNSVFTPTHKQRGYLDFVCQKDQALVDRLLADQRIYTFVRSENTDGTSEIEHNCPDRIDLTLPYGAVFSLQLWEEDNELLSLSEDIPNVYSLLEDAMFITVCMRDFPKPYERVLEATRCLLDALEGRN